MAKSKRRRRTHTIVCFIDGIKEPVKFTCPYDDAKTAVTLDRVEGDLTTGIPGSIMECMNANCGTRLAARFPHPLHLLEFTDTRAFAADRKNGRGIPTHLVRYYHHEGDEQKEFDKPGGKQKLLASGRAKKTFQLLPPSPSVKHIKNPNAKKRKEFKPRKTARKGSYARWFRRKEAA